MKTKPFFFFKKYSTTVFQFFSLISFISRVWIIRKFLHWFFVKRIAKNGKCNVKSKSITFLWNQNWFYRLLRIFLPFLDLALQDLKEKRKKIVSHMLKSKKILICLRYFGCFVIILPATFWSCSWKMSWRQKPIKRPKKF